MLFKSIELQGYKTFANKTVFEFPGAITAIVGPNGSGKSNIADAVRWVLGEQSYSLLRGRKTVDMIFSGSEERSRAGMASASILFDNQTNWLPIEFSEVSITRRAYRDGTNEYLINGQRVRLRDVSELLANSGLSERTYTIIGQGLVDTALALKAEERRKLIEEAAGIGLYRSRREEAQRRLETTLRNLERVEDILSELRPRLISLERQAQRTQQHKQIKEDLRDLLREWYGHHWYQTQRELRQSQVEIRTRRKSLDRARGEYNAFDQKISTLRETIRSLRSKLESRNRELSELQKRREIVDRELAVTGERWRSLIDKQNEYDAELVQLREQATVQEERLDKAVHKAEDLSNQLSEARSSLENIQVKLKTKEPEWNEITGILEDHNRQLEHLLDKRGVLKGQIEERKNYLEQQRNTLAEISQDLNDAKKSHKVSHDKFNSAVNFHQKTADALQLAEQTLESLDKKIDHLELDRQVLLDQKKVHEIELARLSANLKILERIRDGSGSFSRGSKVLIEAVGQNRLSGQVFSLRDHLNVPDELENAINAVLENYLEGLILSGDAHPDYYLKVLEEELADGVLLPSDRLKPDSAIELSRNESLGVIGIASELVEVAPEFKPPVDVLLGHVIVVQDREVANRVIASLSERENQSIRVVTLHGEVYSPSGVIKAHYGIQQLENDQSHQRQNLIEQVDILEKASQELDDRLEDLNDQITSFENERRQHRQRLVSVQNREMEAGSTRAEAVRVRDDSEKRVQWLRKQYQKLLENIEVEEVKRDDLVDEFNLIEVEISEIKGEIRKLKSGLKTSQLDEFNAELSHWDTKILVVESSLDAANRHVEDQTEILENVRTRIGTLEDRLLGISTSLSELEDMRGELQESKEKVMAEIETKMEAIEPIEFDLKEAENELINLRKFEVQARKDLSEAERNYSHAQLELKSRQEEMKSLRERIEHDFGLVEFEYAEEISGPTPLPLNGFVEQLPMVHKLSEGVSDTIKRLRGQLHRIGAVNPEAQREYDEVKDRFAFMTEQVNDLRKAEKDVRKVIKELDSIMEREFLSTFDRVSREFQEVFTRLFGGGSARLLLTSPDDLMSTGVAIEARLPGRRTHGLSLLSGGERSLTATALIFALLKISPTPFCMLDEVDAMLDEANIGRFSEILRELSEDTQFIIITHNRKTVQSAEVIYGITMGKDSTSQVISLKMDEVVEVVS